MPELPEVTVITQQLNKKLKGLVLESVEYDWPKKFFWGGFSIKDLKGKRVEKVERIGKIVSIKVSNVSKVPKVSKGLAILIHLKLTGQLIYQDEKTRIAGGHPIPPLNLAVPNKTTRVTFAFTNGGYLYFNDMRKFGWVKIVGVDESQPEAGRLLDEKVKEAIGAELGPDALEISYDQFRESLAKRGQSRIKKLLMDQNFIAGVGNIYSDEALWRAKIHPKRSAVSLQPLEVRRLYEGIRKSLKLAIAKGGSSANAYVDSGGERGLYLSYAKAYHMTGKPCARCKTPIVRQKMDGRSAHFCPKCQRLK